MNAQPNFVSAPGPGDSRMPNGSSAMRITLVNVCPEMVWTDAEGDEYPADYAVVVSAHAWLREKHMEELCDRIDLLQRIANLNKRKKYDADYIP